MPKTFHKLQHTRTHGKACSIQGRMSNTCHGECVQYLTASSISSAWADECCDSRRTKQLYWEHVWLPMNRWLVQSGANCDTGEWQISTKECGVSSHFAAQWQIRPRIEVGAPHQILTGSHDACQGATRQSASVVKCMRQHSSASWFLAYSPAKCQSFPRVLVCNTDRGILPLFLLQDNLEWYILIPNGFLVDLASALVGGVPTLNKFVLLYMYNPEWCLLTQAPCAHIWWNNLIPGNSNANESKLFYEINILFPGRNCQNKSYKTREAVPRHLQVQGPLWCISHHLYRSTGSLSPDLKSSL